MKSDVEIEARIDELIQDVKSIDAHRPKNLFLYIDEVKKQILKLDEIKHLCWVLNKPVPSEIHKYI